MSTKETMKTTNTTRFLLRGLSLFKAELKQYGFINAFLDDKDHEHHYANSVYLLFQPHDLGTFEWFVESEKMRTHLFLEEYDYPKGYIILVYKFPADYMEDYRLFLRGKYSEFTEKYKELFPKENEGKTSKGLPFKEPSFYVHVFSKSNDLRKFWEDKLDVNLEPNVEVWEVPSIERETLNIKDYE